MRGKLYKSRSRPCVCGRKGTGFSSGAHGPSNRASNQSHADCGRLQKVAAVTAAAAAFMSAIAALITALKPTASPPVPTGDELWPLPVTQEHALLGERPVCTLFFPLERPMY